MRARTCAVGRGIVWPCLVISRAVRMARLREAQEHPDWKWEGERRRAIRDRVEATRGLPAGPWSGSPQSCGEIWIRSASRNCRRQLSCTRQGHYPLPEYGALLQQLVQRAKTLDNDYETLQRLIEPPPARRPVGSEMALAPVNSAATQPDEVDS